MCTSSKTISFDVIFPLSSSPQQPHALLTERPARTLYTENTPADIALQISRCFGTEHTCAYILWFSVYFCILYIHRYMDSRVGQFIKSVSLNPSFKLIENLDSPNFRISNMGKVIVAMFIIKIIIWITLTNRIFIREKWRCMKATSCSSNVIVSWWLPELSGKPRNETCGAMVFVTLWPWRSHGWCSLCIIHTFWEQIGKDTHVGRVLSLVEIILR